MRFRKKKWKAKIGCGNCAHEFKKKFRFGISVVKSGDGLYLWDSINGVYVNEQGEQTQTAHWLFCPKCGARNIFKASWVIGDE